jgi:large subunit ribosomal protein L9
LRIILKETIENLGRAGDIVDVKNGYARNYLIPKKLAIIATEGNLKHLDTIRKKGLEKEARDRAHAQSQAEILNKLILMIPKKVGEEGKLFGSVTGREIYEEIENESEISIDRRKIILKENIKYIGEYPINIRLFPEVEAQVRVRVVDETGREWPELELWRKEESERLKEKEKLEEQGKVKSEEVIEKKRQKRRRRRK